MLINSTNSITNAVLSHTVLHVSTGEMFKSSTQCRITRRERLVNQDKNNTRKSCLYFRDISLISGRCLSLPSYIASNINTRDICINDGIYLVFREDTLKGNIALAASTM